MGIDRNDPKARQLLEKLLTKGSGALASGARKQTAPVRSRDEGVVGALDVRAGARSPPRQHGQDRGKRPVGEGEDPVTAKWARVEEREEEGGVVPSIHPERLKDFLDTSKLVLSGEMSWEGLAGSESTYATSTAMAFEQSLRVCVLSFFFFLVGVPGV